MTGKIVRSLFFLAMLVLAAGACLFSGILYGYYEKQSFAPLSQEADLAAMWRERAPLYARFRDVEIDNSGTVEDTAAAIWRDFCAHSGS